jgi:Flp pilus assembly protein protease CpaA
LVAGAVLGVIVALHQFFRASIRARGPVELAPADSAPVQLPYSLAISVGALTAVITW